jgi:hypothetical protein
MPREGAWTAHLELGQEQAPTGAVVLELGREGGAPVAFAGTVDHADTWQGRQKLFVIGGAGGFGITTATHLNEREWIAKAKAVPAGELVAATLGPEQLAPGVLAALAGRGLARWMRPDGAELGWALSRLVRALGLTWRVLDSGLVWIGEESWPVVADAAASFLEDRDGDLLVDQVAPSAATLRPGTVVLGRRIERVTYTIGEGAPRAKLLARSDVGDFAAAVRRVSRPDVFALLYDAEVRAQGDDGLLDLAVDDTAIRELRRVPWRSFTGARETIPKGARVLVAFLGGREDRPVAFGQAQDPAADDPLALVGDDVEIGWISGAISGPSVILSFLPGPGPSLDPGAVSISGTIKGPGAKYVKAVKGP